MPSKDVQYTERTYVPGFKKYMSRRGLEGDV